MAADNREGRERRERRESYSKPSDLLMSFPIFPSFPSFPQQRIPPSLMGLGFLHVVAPRGSHPLGEHGIDRADYPSRHSHHQRPRWNSHAFRHHSTGSNDTAVTDDDTVKQNAAHGDQAIILHDAAVENDPVPYSNPLPYMTRGPFIHVHDGTVQDI